jgi:arylsulfatase A-like enzyme
VQAGKSSEPIIGVDIYPTLLGIAGVKQPKQTLDGVNLVPLFQGKVKDLGARPLFWHFPAYLQSYKVTHEQRDPLFRTRPCGVIRKGRYKLHEYFEDGGLELYDLTDDIRERNNLADKMPEKRDQLHGLMKAWRKKVDAPIPERN